MLEHKGFRKASTITLDRPKPSERLPTNPQSRRGYAATPPTMLTIEELKQVYDMSGKTLYHAEVKRIPFISREEQKVVIQAARAGDTEAKHNLVVRCLPWVMGRATQLYMEKRPNHIDIMDLIGVANTKMIEHLDKALTANDPMGYLMTIASAQMWESCVYKDSLIQRPRHNNEKLRRNDHTPKNTASLEKPLRDGTTLLEKLPAQEVRLESDETKEAKIEKEYAYLYEAVDQLTPGYRRRIVQFYGLFGETAKTIHEIAVEENGNEQSIRAVFNKARRALGKKLLENKPI